MAAILKRVRKEAAGAGIILRADGFALIFGQSIFFRIVFTGRISIGTFLFDNEICVRMGILDRHQPVETLHTLAGIFMRMDFLTPPFGINKEGFRAVAAASGKRKGLCQGMVFSRIGSFTLNAPLFSLSDNVGCGFGLKCDRTCQCTVSVF